MKTIKLFLLVLLASSFFVSCKKDIDPEQHKADKTADLNVPANFKWKTTKDLNLLIALPVDGFYPLQSKISVFNGNPNQKGTLIMEASISREQDFNQQLRIPAYLQSLFLLLETSTGSTHLVEATIMGNQLSYTFPSTGEKQQMFKATTVVPEEGPDCDDCDVIISGNQSVDIRDGKTYCVQDNFTGSINFLGWAGGGTLKVCGTAIINGSPQLAGNSNIIVTQGGSLTLNGISGYGANNSVRVYANSTFKVNGGVQTIGDWENHGSINITGAFTIQQLTAPFLNTGTLTIGSNLQVNGKILINHGNIVNTGSFTLNTNSTMTNTGNIETANRLEINGSDLTNDGEIKVSNNYFNINGGSDLMNNGSIELLNGDFNVNSSGNMTNNGQITAVGKINFNSGSNVYNNCLMSCTKESAFNSGNINFQNGYFRSDERIQINGGANTLLKDGSMISTKEVYLYTRITGQGSLNSIKAENEFRLSSVQVSGALEVSTIYLNNLSNTPLNQLFVNGATLVDIGEEQNFLAVTNCNPEGIGSVVVNDSDGDGVPDDIDAFPFDPERAFISYYPNALDFTSIAFEDLWPGLGDFDFNDVVVNMQYKMVTNAQNKLVDVYGKFRLMAAGASLNNGFAVAMDINPSYVASVSGGKIAGSSITLDAKGMEAGHTNQTIWIVMDAINDLYQSGGFLNTLPDVPYVETDTIEMAMTLSTPQASYGKAPFNPFIIVNQERGKEVHLLDLPPTALASDEFFGIWEDASVPANGSYYKTDSNLPWAIEIPVSFDYPFEKVDILQTHLKFGDWASSGGDLYPDWYLDKPGYRNQGNIYQKP
ncbi:MAG: LruC domain-containing protein [Bacteroidales bacterium]|jgi:LruC domain-containing protein|nr:LruC domain-containing protein [Bacteroidales bacterium]